ncbi:MAG TPA: sodium-dependent transporter [Longimicrobiales bacterium]
MSEELHSGGAGNRISVAHAGPEHADAPEFAREVWKTRIGFVLAAVGSAVGLGNMWRFPYATAEGGGAAFVMLYILTTFAVGIPVMIAEFSLGRSTKSSPIGALRKAGGRGWTPLGYIFVLTGLIILSYYSVIAGWVTRYALAGAFAGFPQDTGAYFELISTGTPAMGYHLFFMVFTIAIVMGGVEKGIERASFVMLPALYFIVIGLAIWAFTLAGSGEGYAYYLAPSLDEMLSIDTLAAATSQSFFSLSLGMGAMLTFASYLSRNESLPREATIIAFSDFSVAFLAGLVVFPVIFALGLQGAVGESTVGALFISLPGAFNSMGVIGRAVGVLFFVALFIGAITSAISLLEVVTSALIDEWRIPRKKAAVGAGIVITLLGLWPAADIDALGALDAVANYVLLPLGALALAIFVGWLLKNPIDEVAEGVGERFRPVLKVWLWLLRIVAPALLILVLRSNFAATAEALGALFGG